MAVILTCCSNPRIVFTTETRFSTYALEFGLWIRSTELPGGEVIFRDLLALSS